MLVNTVFKDTLKGALLTSYFLQKGNANSLVQNTMSKHEKRDSDKLDISRQSDFKQAPAYGASDGRKIRLQW